MWSRGASTPHPTSRCCLQPLIPVQGLGDHSTPEEAAVSPLPAPQAEPILPDTLSERRENPGRGGTGGAAPHLTDPPGPSQGASPATW